MRSGRERGAAALEVVGTLPILLLSAMVAFQIGVVGWTVVETAEAAQAGARAKTTGGSPDVAVRESLGGTLKPSSLVGELTGAGGYRYTVEVEVPTVVPVLSLGSVTRSAEMRVPE